MVLKAAFLQERPMLMRLLVARLGSREDAEDAAQELWLKLGDEPAEPIVNAAAYLYRMASNLASDRRASAASATARDKAWLAVQPDATEIPDAERVLIARERLRQVDITLAAMPERMRTAFQMFRVEKQSQKIIATTLGISVSGVEKLLQRAYRLVHDATAHSGEDITHRHRLGHMKDSEL